MGVVVSHIRHGICRDMNRLQGSNGHGRHDEVECWNQGSSQKLLDMTRHEDEYPSSQQRNETHHRSRKLGRDEQTTCAPSKRHGCMHLPCIVLPSRVGRGRQGRHRNYGCPPNDHCPHQSATVNIREAVWQRGIRASGRRNQTKESVSRTR